MPVSSSKSPLVLIIALLGLSACETPFSKNTFDLADQLTQILKVPVFVWADPNNYCVNRQIESLVNEFSEIDSQTREKTLGRLQKFRSIIIEESVSSPKITGDRTELELKKSNFWTWLGTSKAQVDRILVKDERKPVDGSPWPETSYTVAQDLTISPVHAEDRSRLRLFTTYDPELFQQPPSVRELDAKADAGEIERKETPSTGLNCGKLLQLSEIDFK